MEHASTPSTDLLEYASTKARDAASLCARAAERMQAAARRVDESRARVAVVHAARLAAHGGKVVRLRARTRPPTAAPERTAAELAPLVELDTRRTEHAAPNAADELGVLGRLLRATLWELGREQAHELIEAALAREPLAEDGSLLPEVAALRAWLERQR